MGNARGVAGKRRARGRDDDKMRREQKDGRRVIDVDVTSASAERSSFT